MQKTRVMFVVLQLDAGGSERVVLDLASGLNSDQFEIYVTAFNGGVFEAPLRKVCKDVFIIEKRRRIDFSAMVQLAKIIREHRVDIVNAHHYMPCFYSFLGTRILNRKKLIYTEHSVPEVEGISSGKHGKILNLMLYRMNAVIGVSKEITERFKERYPRHAKKIHEILNGVDIDKFNVKGTRNHVRKRWGLTNDHFVVGTVANFRKVKNHACLVRAAARLKDDYPQLRLFLVGTGFPGDPDNTESSIQELIHANELQDHIILAGFKKNIPELLSVFDVFCLPSFSEGLPVSILEAMAAKVPVVGSNVSGISEIIKDEDTGLLFSSDNDLELSRKIVKLIDEPSLRNKIASNAFQYVKINHGFQDWVASYRNIFQHSL